MSDKVETVQGGTAEVFVWTVATEPGIVWLIVDEYAKPGAARPSVTIGLLVHEAQELAEALESAADTAALQLPSDG